MVVSQITYEMKGGFPKFSDKAKRGIEVWINIGDGKARIGDGNHIMKYKC